MNEPTNAPRTITIAALCATQEYKQAADGSWYKSSEPTPTVKECEAAGRGPEQKAGKFREGGLPNTPEERALFEAYMRGHCWGTGGYDNEKQCYDTTMVRMLYGIWRDRGELAQRTLAVQRTKLLEIAKDCRENGMQGVANRIEEVVK